MADTDIRNRISVRFVLFLFCLLLFSGGKNRGKSDFSKDYRNRCQDARKKKRENGISSDNLKSESFNYHWCVGSLLILSFFL